MLNLLWLNNFRTKIIRYTVARVLRADVFCHNRIYRSYCSKLSTLATLDDQYMEGLPNLYSNEPRQFHVRVPCHSRFNRSRVCQGPATIVFRVRNCVIVFWDGFQYNNFIVKAVSCLLWSPST